MKTAFMVLAAALLLTGASGAASADDPDLSSVTVSTQAGTLTYGTGGTTAYTVTVTRRADVSYSSAFSVALSQIALLPAGAAVVSFVPSTLDFGTGETSKTSTLTIRTIGQTPSAATAIAVKATRSDGYIVGSGTLMVLQAPATVKANEKSKVYGASNPGLDATVTGEVPGDPIQYTLARAGSTAIRIRRWMR
jgi:MBG domain-containing protein